MRAYFANCSRASSSPRAPSRRPIVPTSANSRKNVVLALEVVGDLDRFRQRAGLVRPHHLAEQALVRVEVQIEQPGQHEAAGCIELLLRFRR
jgi:hypothetical protein